jgi:hypothetical protein
MDSIRIIITGINKNSAEIHVVDIINNKYLNGFFVMGDCEKLASKIQSVIEIYETASLIIDKKKICGQARDILKEKDIVD